MARLSGEEGSSLVGTGERVAALEHALGDLVGRVNRCGCQCACDYDAALDLAEALLGLPVGGEPR